jgi:hypothetical protein
MYFDQRKRMPNMAIVQVSFTPQQINSKDSRKKAKAIRTQTSKGRRRRRSEIFAAFFF